MTTRERGELPPELQKILDRILEEDREVFEALARSNTISEKRNNTD